MKLEITARHTELTEELKDFAAKRLAKLERLLGPIDAHVVLEVEKHRHIAEIQVHSKFGDFTGVEETADLETSIRAVAEKVEKQARRHKDKIADHKHRQGPRDPDVAATIAENASKDFS